MTPPPMPALKRITRAARPNAALPSSVIPAACTEVPRRQCSATRDLQPNRALRGSPSVCYPRFFHLPDALAKLHRSISPLPAIT